MRVSLSALLLLPCVAATGCGLALGLSDFQDAEGQGGGTTATTGTSTTTTGTTTTTTGTGGSSGSTGGGGAGGSGGSGGGMVCTPNVDTQSCYSGPANTEGVGACLHGLQTCNAAGTAFEGPCIGEVLPKPEVCATDFDDDCDGSVNEEGADCACVPSSTSPCYTADPQTLGVGPCTGGTQTCKPDGTGYGPCVGEVTPTAETCDQGLVDEDCDNQSNEEGPNCVCVPGSTESCYTGPVGTENVGLCKAGTHTCDAVGVVWSPCSGQVTPSPETCGVPGDEDCSGAGCSDPVWAQLLGDAASQKGTGVGVDAAHNVYVTGAFAGAMTVGASTLIAAGSDDIFLVKLDQNGVPIWSKQFGDPGTQIAGPLVVDPNGNVLIAGYTPAAINFGGGNVGPGLFVAKFSPAGNHLWSKGYGGSSQSAVADIDVDASGNPVIAGEFTGTADFGNGAYTSAGGLDSFLAKLTAATGAGIWSKRFGDNTNQRGRGVAVDSGGNILFTSGLEGVASFGGANLTSAGAIDIVVAKFDSAGNHAWSKRFGDAAQQYPDHLDVDSLGNVIVVGQFGGTLNFGASILTAQGTDAFAAKLNTSGNQVWAQRFGGANYDDATAVEVDSSGDIVIAGYSDGPIDFGGGNLQGTGNADVFLAKLDSTGGHKWSKIFGNNLLQFAARVATGPSDEILFTGYAHGVIDFGLGPMTSAGLSDVFVAKFAP